MQSMDVILDIELVVGITALLSVHSWSMHTYLLDLLVKYILVDMIVGNNDGPFSNWYSTIGTLQSRRTF